MKQSIVLGLISTTVFFASSCYAEYSFYLDSTQSCRSIAGEWSGTGTASSWLIGTCKYHGTGTVGSVDENGHFTVSLTAVKDSGSALCPSRGTERLHAVCDDDVVIIKTHFGNLSGTFSAETGNANGVLSVSPGLDANVSITMSR